MEQPYQEVEVTKRWLFMPLKLCTGAEDPPIAQCCRLLSTRNGTLLLTQVVVVDGCLQKCQRVGLCRWGPWLARSVCGAQGTRRSAPGTEQEWAMNLTLLAGTGRRSKLWQVLNYGCKRSVLVECVI